MEWNTRASRVETRLGGLSEWRHWKTRDRRYRVSQRKWRGHEKRPTLYYACVREKTPTGGCWEVLSKHRKRSRAVEACEAHNRNQGVTR